MSADLSADLLSELRSYVRRGVRAGFASVAEIPDAAVEYLRDDAAPEALRPYAEQYTAEALVALSEEQETWPEVTDCDRLDAAFAALETVGIVARQNFSCCQNCGHGEMWDEVEGALANGEALRGYTFFHAQDTETAVEGGSLWLAYGSVEEGESALIGIGDDIVSALKVEGLDVSWDRNPKTRISVQLDWRKRL
jgi:hypothetical protein